VPPPPSSSHVDMAEMSARDHGGRRLAAKALSSRLIVGSGGLKSIWNGVAHARQVASEGDGWLQREHGWGGAEVWPGGAHRSSCEMEEYWSRLFIVL